MFFGRSGSQRSEGTEVAAAVLGYLGEHPDAADTLEGIVRWWLPRQRYETEKARIEKVLEALVGEGVLHREHLTGGTVLYTLAKRPGDEAGPHPLQPS